MEKNILTLLNCAYIFHWSNDTCIFSNKHEEKAKINKILKSCYDVSVEKRTFIYHLTNNGQPKINISGVDIIVNDSMIENITGSYENKNIINNINYKNFDSFINTNTGLFHSYNKYNNQCYFYSKDFNSFEFELFTKKSINYYRIHFNKNIIKFVVSNNKIYISGYKYNEISINDIFEILDVRSAKAKKIFNKIFAFILSK